MCFLHIKWTTQDHPWPRSLEFKIGFQKSCVIEQSHCLERSFDLGIASLLFFWDLTKKWCFCLKCIIYIISVWQGFPTRQPPTSTKKHGHTTGHGPWEFLPLSGAILGLDVCIRKPLDTRPGLVSAFGGRGTNPLKKWRPSKDVWPYDAYMVICWLYIYTCIYAYICHFKWPYHAHTAVCHKIRGHVRDVWYGFGEVINEGSPNLMIFQVFFSIPKLICFFIGSNCKTHSYRSGPKWWVLPWRPLNPLSLRCSLQIMFLIYFDVVWIVIDLAWSGGIRSRFGNVAVEWTSSEQLFDTFSVSAWQLIYSTSPQHVL